MGGFFALIGLVILIGKIANDKTTRSNTCTENYEKMYGFAKGEPCYKKGLMKAMEADKRAGRM